MIVEAIFWFHPLVWWIGARLVVERERSCDERVLEQGGDPETYAESILRTCRLCLKSPLPCVSGVTGSDLVTRIERILERPTARNLDFSRKLLLSVACAVLVAAPVIIGLSSPKPAFSQSVPVT